MFKVNDHSGLSNGLKKVEIASSSCVFMVCPGDRRFTHNRLKSCVTALNRAGFQKVIVIVADGSLQGLSKKAKMPNLNIAELIEESIESGLAWENDDNNKKELRALRNGCVKHWNEIIVNDANFSGFLEQAKFLYQNNIEFKKELDRSVRAYLNRHLKIESVDDNNPSWQPGLDYKLMEVAGLFVKDSLGFTFLAYPGDLCPGLQYALDNFIQHENPHSLLYLKINLYSKIQKILFLGDTPFDDFILGTDERPTTPTIDGHAEYGVSSPPPFLGKALASTGIFHSSGTDDSINPIFTQVDFCLRNCKNNTERTKIVLGLQVLLAKHTVGVFVESQDMSQLVRTNGKNGDSRILEDGGLKYPIGVEEQQALVQKNNGIR